MSDILYFIRVHFDNIKAIISLILACIQTWIAIRTYKKQRRDNREPFRSIAFILMFILAIILIGLTVFLTSRVIRKNQTRIVLLMPIDPDETSAPYRSGKKILRGYIDFLTEDLSVTRDFSFGIENHAMRVDRAEDIICDELSHGTEYFVCTMSEVASTLSTRFNGIVNRCSRWWRWWYWDIDPKLIFTFTSTPDIYLQEGSIYRFYIRSEEEARHLALAGNQSNFNQRAVSIVVNDDYGQTAEEEFQRQWEDLGNTLVTEIFLEPMLSRESIESTIQDYFQALNGVDIIFIVHHGSGICDIVCSLDELDIHPTILVTSPILSWKTSIQNHLNNFEWKTCAPITSASDPYAGDLIRDFTRFTLRRLTRTINSYNTTGQPFHECWQECEHPVEIDFTPLEGGDAIIRVEEHFQESHN